MSGSSEPNDISRSTNSPQVKSFEPSLYVWRARRSPGTIMRMEDEVYKDGQTFESYSSSGFAPHRMELFWINYLPFVKTPLSGASVGNLKFCQRH